MWTCEAPVLLGNVNFCVLESGFEGGVSGEICVHGFIQLLAFRIVLSFHLLTIIEIHYGRLVSYKLKAMRVEIISCLGTGDIVNKTSRWLDGAVICHRVSVTGLEGARG